MVISKTKDVNQGKGKDNSYSCFNWFIWGKQLLLLPQYEQSLQRDQFKEYREVIYTKKPLSQKREKGKKIIRNT